MSDVRGPVEIAAEGVAMVDMFTEHKGVARAALAALHAAGWRIVRTESVKPVMVERDWRLIEEWTP